jgi:hypothetical protein
MYITRLTPNQLGWERPSGRLGKCRGSVYPIYEQRNGFGWEEWLLADYWAGHETCRGFIQALNEQNQQIETIDALHLYTRYCDEKKNKQNNYIGCINNVRVLPPQERTIQHATEKAEYNKHLEQAGLPPLDPDYAMWQHACNLQFNRNDVSLFLNERQPHKINPLDRNFYRFALYDVEKHGALGEVMRDVGG